MSPGILPGKMPPWSPDAATASRAPSGDPLLDWLEGTLSARVDRDYMQMSPRFVRLRIDSSIPGVGQVFSLERGATLTLTADTPNVDQVQFTIKLAD